MNARTLRAIRALWLESARMTRYDTRRAAEAPGYVAHARAVTHTLVQLARAARSGSPVSTGNPVSP